MNKRQQGSWFEDVACEYVEASGAGIIKRNYRVRSGEIDIIAKDGKYYCFIEVKYRKDSKYGGPESAVDYFKQKQISNVSRHFLSYILKSIEVPVRYDVIAINGEKGAVTVRWLKNAFEYMGG